MGTDVAAAISTSIREQGPLVKVDVVWHGGEPLALRRAHFTELCSVFEPLRRTGVVRHFIQTNATLVDDEWCDFFKRFDFSVGVSLDGPEGANSNRVDWSGRPAFTRAMRGVDALKRNGLKFSAICVVTSETVVNPGRIFDFFEAIGAESVGFNMEEREGANGGRDVVTPGAARRFWRALVERVDGGSVLRSRDVGRLLAFLSDIRSGRADRWANVAHDAIPTVSWKGDTVFLSPELSGVKDQAHGDFIIGNVLDESIPQMIKRVHRVPYVAQFFQGVAECRMECEFFSYCQGGQAGNRYFESGDFTATETDYCRNGKQQLVLALRDYIGEAE